MMKGVMKPTRFMSMLSVSLATVALAACIQFPSEKQSVIDMRPAITFKASSADAFTLDPRVLVDGLDAGRLGDYLEGKSSLRVLSGNHVVQVIKGGVNVLEQRVYLGDGVTRSFLVN